MILILLFLLSLASVDTVTVNLVPTFHAGLAVTTEGYATLTVSEGYTVAVEGGNPVVSDLLAATLNGPVETARSLIQGMLPPGVGSYRRPRSPHSGYPSSG